MDVYACSSGILEIVISISAFIMQYNIGEKTKVFALNAGCLNIIVFKIKTGGNDFENQWALELLCQF